jgi:hypothetical protein
MNWIELAINAAALVGEIILRIEKKRREDWEVDAVLRARQWQLREIARASEIRHAVVEKNPDGSVAFRPDRWDDGGGMQSGVR